MFSLAHSRPTRVVSHPEAQLLSYVDCTLFTTRINIYVRTTFSDYRDEIYIKSSANFLFRLIRNKIGIYEFVPCEYHNIIKIPAHDCKYTVETLVNNERNEDRGTFGAKKKK